MFVIVLAAAAVLLGVLVGRRTGPRITRLLALLLAIESVAIVGLGEIAFAAPAAVAAAYIVSLVLALAILVVVIACASAGRSLIGLAGAACWTFWWASDAALWLWGVRTALGQDASPPTALGIVPVIAGALAGLGTAIAAVVRGKQRGGGALVAMVVGFALAWVVGEQWVLEAALVDDAARIAALHRFSEVGLVGWHVALAVVVWRSALTNLPPVHTSLPPARVVS